MKRDPRPVSQQVLSGLKIGAVLIGIGAVVLISFSYMPVHRIEAYIWHLRHGNTIDVGQYRLPAPRQWFVKRISDAVLMGDLSTGDRIFAQQSGLLKGRTLSEWSDLVGRKLASETMKTTGQREFHIAGETFLCIEQDVDFGPKLGRIYSIQCLSDGGLEVHFQSPPGIGREHDATFYSLLPQIQKL